MRPALAFLAVAALSTLALAAALAPAASAEPCVTYQPLGLTHKTRTCVNPDDVPGCPVSSTSYTPYGTWSSCLGADGLPPYAEPALPVLP